jgi:predicted aminopeptidase
MRKKAHCFWTTRVLVALVVGLCGCQTSRFYGQAIRGEYQVLKQRKSTAELLKSPGLSSELKIKFELVGRLRAFAQNELRLPIDKHYVTYVDLGRRFAVWNVHAAPGFSLEPKKWWYPFVGSLKYRGYFSEPDARRYASGLEEEGYDVYVEGVEAYSTLGWFADPLLNTFIHHSEAELAEIIFHELGHQRLFLPGDTDFNEAFATTVAEEGVRRWFRDKDDEAGYHAYLRELERNRQFVGVVMNARQQLESLYAQGQGNEAYSNHAPTPALPEGKAQVIAGLRQDYERLKASWGGDSAYDGWFARPLNNAQLNTIALYYQLVPGFEALLQGHGGDLEAFYQSVRAMRKLDKDERKRRLIAAGAG